jgi:hypothetical protein
MSRVKVVYEIRVCIHTTTCALQRDGQIFLTVDRSDCDHNSVLTIAVIYLVRNTSDGILPGLRDALRNDCESIAERVRYSSPLQWFHVASGSQPAFYSTDIGTFYSRLKRPKRADNLRLAWRLKTRGTLPPLFLCFCGWPRDYFTCFSG